MRIVIDHDLDPDFSPYTAEERARGLVALQVSIYHDGEEVYGDPVASLYNITFFRDSTEWTVDNFGSVEEIPATCTHLREVARQLLDEVPESVDDDGEESMFVNFYKCDRCDHEWQDKWSCQCDDDCPECGFRHMTPYKSEDA